MGEGWFQKEKRRERIRIRGHVQVSAHTAPGLTSAEPGYCPSPRCCLTPAPVLSSVTSCCHQRQILTGFTCIIQSVGHQLTSLPGEAQHGNVNPAGLGSAREAVCQTSGSYLFPPVSPGDARVHLNTDTTTFVEDHVFFFSLL